MSSFPFETLLKSPVLMPRFVVLILSLSWLTVLYVQVRVAPTAVIAALWLILLLGAFWRYTPILIVAILGALLYASPRHPLDVYPSDLPPLSWQETFFCASVVTFLAIHFQWTLAWRNSSKSGRVREEDIIGRVARETAGAALGGMAVAGAARYVLPFLYLGQEAGPTLRMHPLLAGLLTAVIGFAGITFLWIAIVRIALRRAVRKEEAELIVNEAIYREMRGDLLRLTRPRR